jgi:hypothetical protein
MRFAVSKSPNSTAFRIAVLLTIVPFDSHRLNPNDGKVQLCAELFQEREITGTVFPKRTILVRHRSLAAAWPSWPAA